MLEKYQTLLNPIYDFLQCETPDAWVTEAIKPENLHLLLLDHMHCELKAAQSAAFLIRKYAIDDKSARGLLAWLKPYEDFVYRGVGDGQFSEGKNALVGELQAKEGDDLNQDILDKMVRLIKEELHHFEQVLAIIQQRDFSIEPSAASRYAASMIKHVRTYEPAALIDKLIIGAFIEARSCERFAKLAPFLNEELAKFYISLLRSEARHYQDYIALASDVAAQTDPIRFNVEERIAFFAEVEAQLILTDDANFKFHSGVPLA
ncbi:tRNA isopentenyl-2-thiomethyl-A-37 hydroxylase MiaE [Pseudoalteromonas tunicata]|jgi:tRNA-(ms[2]io[6]A)-hydroxylase|uniref:tRNA-(MS[2]IO[6]A)-hydroxylase n=1 Tax=Pseudoalteromonas tunicata D2 TaxID=87626 RepID=A4CD10_9GAMM|nr:tRNA isopentenyl-2-thiomethyl-A-37 hydroxylase MiaE [Pseudoalteromonas tunicata]ATC93960.1 tRNA-(ms[2]io[6]A)-hydroxylase [Pseudoalteromonas tunicata]AXT29748.1 tRNA-(ms[2]io[6]A)-hydroxylase [Pseudoalteromonas tunicata]EAR27453.1 tRNA-(MS[2]IO[6]A)-hydroxylase [Pseudoalteromonas tunicata D2]